jgi:hypothetical protein
MKFMFHSSSAFLERAQPRERECGHGDVGDRVTNDENATGVPRRFAGGSRSAANHHAVMRLAAIGQAQFAITERPAAALFVPHIRKAAVEFRSKRRPRIACSSPGRIDRRRNAWKYEENTTPWTPTRGGTAFAIERACDGLFAKH